MNEIEQICNWLGIGANDTSKRIAFIKEAHLSDVWHIADHQGLIEAPDGPKDYLLIICLHGSYLPKVVTADSITGIALQERSKLRLCSKCVDEFRLCFDDIQARPDSRFAATHPAPGERL